MLLFSVMLRNETRRRKMIAIAVTIALAAAFLFRPAGNAARGAGWPSAITTMTGARFARQQTPLDVSYNHAP